MSSITGAPREIPSESTLLPATLVGVVGSYMPETAAKKQALVTVETTLSSQSIRETDYYKKAEAAEDQQTLRAAVSTFTHKRASARHKKELEGYERAYPGIVTKQLQGLENVTATDAAAPLVCSPLQGKNVRDCTFLQYYVQDSSIDESINEELVAIINLVKEQCPHLSAFAFGNNALITPQPLLQLLPAPELRRLIAANSFNWVGNSPSGAREYAAAFSSFTSLYELDLSSGIAFTDDDLKEMITKLTELQSLQLSTCLYLTKATIEALASRPHLRHLNLATCRAMMEDSSAFQSLLQLRELVSLGLGEWRSLKDEDLEALVTACPHLQHLDLSYCSGMTAAGLVAHIGKLKNCRSLNLRGWKSLTGPDLKLLGVALPNLEYLDLSYCGKLNENDLPELVKAFPKLKGLDITGMSLTQETFDSILALRDLRRFNFDMKGVNVQALVELPNLESCSTINSFAPEIDAQLAQLRIAFQERHGRGIVLHQAQNAHSTLIHEPYRIAIQ